MGLLSRFEWQFFGFKLYHTWWLASSEVCFRKEIIYTMAVVILRVSLKAELYSACIFH